MTVKSLLRLEHYSQETIREDLQDIVNSMELRVPTELTCENTNLLSGFVSFYLKDVMDANPQVLDYNFDFTEDNTIVVTFAVDEDYCDNSLVSKTLSCEIDGELFFKEISMDTKAWNFDYDSLEDYPEVEEYLKENYEQEYEMLKEGKADYIEVWYD